MRDTSSLFFLFFVITLTVVIKPILVVCRKRLFTALSFVLKGPDEKIDGGAAGVGDRFRIGGRVGVRCGDRDCAWRDRIDNTIGDRAVRLGVRGEAITTATTTEMVIALIAA